MTDTGTAAAQRSRWRHNPAGTPCRSASVDRCARQPAPFPLTGVTERRSHADHPDRRMARTMAPFSAGRADRILFVVGVVKWLAGFSSLTARVPAWPA